MKEESMTECESLKACPFFNDELANMPKMAETIKTNYCRADFVSCARFMVSKALGKEFVPRDLFPNQSARAKEIISGQV